jgi:hypothetical protein
MSDNINIEVLLHRIEEIRCSDMPGNIKASKIFSVRCQLKKLGWSDGSTSSGSETWCCPKCGSRIVTHVPVLEVACGKHSPTVGMTHA